jgi:hypothetical protein
MDINIFFGAILPIIFIFYYLYLCDKIHLYLDYRLSLITDKSIMTPKDLLHKYKGLFFTKIEFVMYILILMWMFGMLFTWMWYAVAIRFIINYVYIKIFKNVWRYDEMVLAYRCYFGLNVLFFLAIHYRYLI